MVPYNPISVHYKKLFGEKVYKISVAVAKTCPNREGIRGMKTCNFCDQWGSSAYHKNLNRPLREQIESVKETLRRKRGANKFLVYFQAYTTTFQQVGELSEQFQIALSYSDVVGLVVGTRPDCVSGAFVDLLNAIKKQTYIAVELGVQTFDEQQLIWMRRGHTAQKSLQAIERLAKQCPGVELGLHLIFGLPGETTSQVIETARLINTLPIQNVKLHHLHVLKGAELERDFALGHFQPVERDVYFERCAQFLANLDPRISVHRLAAYAPRWDELIAPEWTSYKMKTNNDFLEYMGVHHLTQGCQFSPCDLSHNLRRMSADQEALSSIT